MFYNVQRGSTLIVALFVIVVMGILASALVRIDWSNQDITTREVLGTRAWFMAHSGNEIMLSRLFPLEQRSSEPAQCQTVEVNPKNSYGCRTRVACTNQTVIRNGNIINHYQLTSEATCGTGQFSVKRTQELWAKDIEQ